MSPEIKRKRRSFDGFKKSLRGKEIWDELLIEQMGNCALCKNALFNDDIHFDHKIPLSRGGTNDKSNLQLVHQFCNTMKSDRINLPKNVKKMIKHRTKLRQMVH